MAQKIEVLETTLRDGSYALDFAFTAADTATICRELEAVGLRWIEIGHGVGLRASERGYGRAAATDEEYLDAARGALTRAKFGMFCIPGIARVEDVEMAARRGMSFIRIGTNVTDVEASEPFIQAAKDLGLFVAANYMKSYAEPPEKFAEKVKLSEGYGADLVYIVDSAGGMFPSDVRNYHAAIRRVTTIPIGFHGHDNLGLAVANSLEMAELGCAFVDSSLQGLGRSAGNAPTELLVAALHKQGRETGVDLLQLLRLGRRRVQPLLLAPGRMPLDVMAGVADFHSSFMPKLLRAAGRNGVDPARLMVELCKIDRVHAPDDLLDKLAAGLPRTSDPLLEEYGYKPYTGGEEDERKG